VNIALFKRAQQLSLLHELDILGVIDDPQQRKPLVYNLPF